MMKSGIRLEDQEQKEGLFVRIDGRDDCRVRSIVK